MMNELRQIARAMHTARPEWDLAGCLTVLARLDITHPGLPDPTPARIRAAAERVALDPAARTPAAITFGRYWAPEAAVTARRLAECASCRRPVRRLDDHGRAVPAPRTCLGCGRPWREHAPVTEHLNDGTNR